tara:strand:+ start:1183 stop:2136 length:954 start_codon:yes stop_codon:yes gene_type:complete
MTNFFLGLSVVKTSLIISLASLFFVIIFISPSYKSQSIIDVSGLETQVATESILSSLTGNGSENVYQLKAFLNSVEASNIFKENIDVDKIFSSSDISFFSRYKMSRFRSFHDYYNKKVELLIDLDSNAIIINTFAFNPQDAQFINLQIINMAADFFNRKTRVSSFNEKTNKICELYSINANILNLDMANLEDDDDLVEESKTATELLLSKSIRYKDMCIEKLTNEDDNIMDNIEVFPSFELRNINAEASKQVLLEIYDKSLGTISTTSFLKIIAEPVTPIIQEKKNAFLLSLLVFAVSFISILSIKILLRLSDDFEV